MSDTTSATTSSEMAGLSSIETPALKPVAVGDKVWYVPAWCHHLDRSPKGVRVWEFRHTQDSKNFRKGDPVDWGTVGAASILNRHPATGQLVTLNGYIVEPGEPFEDWPAVVTAVHPDGSADLEITHPFGGITMEYPKRKHDTEGDFDTFHVEGE
jgi:hypothetical protein